MGERVLITGGAGFIGSHLADELLQAGYPVRVLDSLLAYEPQTHLDAGLAELAGWLVEQTAVDRVDQATRELERRGLTL